MATATRNRPARKATRTRTTTAHHLRPGHRLTGWATYSGQPVTVVAVDRTGPRRWVVTVAHDGGTLEAAEFLAGEPITREV